MKELLKQLGGLAGAGIAAACCLGLPVVLSAVGAAGLSFLIHDAYLFPIFVGFVGISLWLLYRSARGHGRLKPFWLGLGGGLFGATGLWLMVTGVYPMSWSVYVGVGVLVLGSVWDFVNGRQASVCATDVCEEPATYPEEVNLSRRSVNGTAIAVAAAGAFYAMYKSVDAFTPGVESGEIACWGINQCKGTTACTTAFNACTGQNACKGRGYIYVPEKECFSQGGVSLEGSEGDPAKGGS